MTRKPGLLVWPSHRELSVVAATPLLRRIKIDILRTTKAVHRVIHLDTFPAMIVIVFVKHEIHRGPTCVEELVVTLLVRHVHQLVDPPPVVPLKTAVEFRIAFERRILVRELPIRYAWTTRATQRHVVISLVAFGGIVVEIEGHECLAQHAREFSDVLVEWRHRIEPAHRHLRRAIAVEIVESKRIFPVETRIDERLRRTMYFQKKSVAVVVRQPVCRAG